MAPQQNVSNPIVKVTNSPNNPAETNNMDMESTPIPTPVPAIPTSTASQPVPAGVGSSAGSNRTIVSSLHSSSTPPDSKQHESVQDAATVFVQSLASDAMNPNSPTAHRSAELLTKLIVNSNASNGDSMKQHARAQHRHQSSATSTSSIHTTSSSITRISQSTIAFSKTLGRIRSGGVRDLNPTTMIWHTTKRTGAKRLTSASASVSTSSTTSDQVLIGNHGPTLLTECIHGL